jgi:hypothetical protein
MKHKFSLYTDGEDKFLLRVEVGCNINTASGIILQIPLLKNITLW